MTDPLFWAKTMTTELEQVSRNSPVRLLLGIKAKQNFHHPYFSLRACSRSRRTTSGFSMCSDRCRYLFFFPEESH